MTFFWKINLINLTSKSLRHLIMFLGLNVSVYRYLFIYLYKEYISDLTLFTKISFYDKELLASTSVIRIITCKKKVFDKDNTIKLLFGLGGGCVDIEAVLIPNRKNHYTLCVSSQSGCVLHCTFCSTGTLGFYKNLSHSEIISQLFIAAHFLKAVFKNKSCTNIVFMGMGEPLFNINNLLAAIDTISSYDSFNISRNKISVSSSGVSNYFDILKKNNIRLALSLHATLDALRTKIMSINKKNNIALLLKKCLIFKKKNELTIEYLMLKGINDTLDDVKRLVKLLTGVKCKVCLIPFNSFDGTKYKSSPISVIRYFKKILNDNNITTTIRKSMGVGIYGACGQLSGKK